MKWQRPQISPVSPFAAVFPSFQLNAHSRTTLIYKIRVPFRFKVSVFSPISYHHNGRLDSSGREARGCKLLERCSHQLAGRDPPT